jgi:hypothetical protein
MLIREFSIRGLDLFCGKRPERSGLLRSGSRGNSRGGRPYIVFLLSGAFLLAAFSFAQEKRSETAHGDSRIAGVIVSKTDGHPVARARVTIADTHNRQDIQSIITEEDGKFAFSGLAAGKYALEGAKRGYIAAGYDQHEGFSTAIVTGAGLDTEHLVLKLASNGVIAGRVLDEAGEPVRQAAVTVYVDTHEEGVEQISAYRSAQTNDLGMYEMAQLRPGIYYLAASAKPWYAIHGQSPASASEAGNGSEPGVDPSLDVAYAVTYYADVTDPDSATAIPIRGGERVQVDVHLTPVPALRLRFHSPQEANADRAHHGAFNVPQLEQPGLAGSVPVSAAELMEVSPGEWEIAGIPAGRYNVRLPRLQREINGVDVSRSGEEIDISKGETLSTVNVAVRPAQGSSLPRQFVVALRGGSRSFAGARMMDQNGNVELPGVSAGSYELVTFGAGNRYSMEHVTVDGAEITGHTITVPAEASVSVEISVVAGTGTVGGIAKRGGKGVAGAMVVLVPEHPEGNRDLFRRDQSDLDGTFALPNVIPGTYTVVAIENGWDIDWSRPEVIAAYGKSGRKIEVGSRSRAVVHVSEPVEVVSR